MAIDRAGVSRNFGIAARGGIRMGERSFEATARVLDSKADGERYRKAQSLATEKYSWATGSPSSSPRINLGPEAPRPKRTVLTPGACAHPLLGTV